MRQGCAIVLLSIAAAVVYGILHDQLTARVCLEYFTVAHPKVVDSTDPTVLAFVWGTIATWWAGAMIGVPLALAARVGPAPKWDARRLARPMLCLLAVMGACALVAAYFGYGLGTGPIGVLLGDHLVPPAALPRFSAVAFAHNASYLVGFAGGLVLCLYVGLARVAQAGRGPSVER